MNYLKISILFSVLISVTYSRDLYFGLFNVKNKKDSRISIFSHQSNNMSSEPNTLTNAAETQLIAYDSHKQIGYLGITEIETYCPKGLTVEFPYKSLNFEEGMRFPDLKLNEKPSTVTEEVFLQGFAKRKLSKSTFLIEDVDESLFINTNTGNCLFFIGNSRFVVSRTVIWLKAVSVKIRNKLIQLDRTALDMSIEAYNDSKLGELDQAIKELGLNNSTDKVNALIKLQEQLRLSNWILSVTSNIHKLVGDSHDRAVQLTLNIAISASKYLTALSVPNKRLIV